MCMYNAYVWENVCAIEDGAVPFHYVPFGWRCQHQVSYQLHGVFAGHKFLIFPTTTAGEGYYSMLPPKL